MCDVSNERIFSHLRDLSIPIVYGPLDSFAYKVELRNESWRNVQKLIKSKAKFALMSDHPVILQRNLFYSLLHLLRFGLSRADAISKITKESAEIIGARRLGQISKGYTASFSMRNDDPFILSSYPENVMAEEKIVYRE